MWVLSGPDNIKWILWSISCVLFHSRIFSDWLVLIFQVAHNSEAVKGDWFETEKGNGNRSALSYEHCKLQFLFTCSGFGGRDERRFLVLLFLEKKIKENPREKKIRKKPYPLDLSISMYKHFSWGIKQVIKTQRRKLGRREAKGFGRKDGAVVSTWACTGSVLSHFWSCVASEELFHLCLLSVLVQQHFFNYCECKQIETNYAWGWETCMALTLGGSRVILW